MSLAKQLRPILEEVLPKKPDDAILGTKLLQLVKPRIIGDYADNSILMAFSGLAKDATSPIARIEQGFGYYRRPAPQIQIQPSNDGEGVSESKTGVIAEGGRDAQPEEKFRAFFIRNSQYDNRFPVHIEHTAGAHQPAGVNKWKFPDVLNSIGMLANRGMRDSGWIKRFSR